ncbi:MAG: phosphopyruvate hydratase [Rhodospirillales bacterium]
MAPYLIENVIGRRVWDSRGRPTVEAEVFLSGGAIGRAIAPAGASTGSGEAVDRRDGGSAFGGMDVKGAVSAVTNEISKVIRGLDAREQASIDLAMIQADGTENRGRIGANAIVAVSMAVAWAAAAQSKEPLWRILGADAVQMPLPEIQIFGGGAHAGRRVDVQDFLIVCPGAESFAQALDWTAEIYRSAGALMEDRGKLMGVADEGGFWPAFDRNEEALDALTLAIQNAGFKAPDDVAIALDIASSEFGHRGRYKLALEARDLSSEEMADQIQDWTSRYPIVSVEDPLAEDDWDGMAELTKRIGNKVQVVGDDFLVTDAVRVKQAAEIGACNTVLLKPNQRGTLTETLAAWEAAKKANFGAIVSARSGETEDTTIIHLAVGWGVPQFKVGSFTRSERMAKWNEAIRIEEELGAKATFAGHSALRR